MVEMKVVKPLDIDGFLVLFSNYDYSAAARAYTNFSMKFDEWKAGREMLFRLIEVI